MSAALDNKLLRYLLVGLLNTAVGYSLFALFIYLNLHYSLAVFMSTVFGVLFNFKSIGKLVFKNNDNSLIYRYLVVYSFLYLLNVSGLRLLSHFSLNMYLAGGLLLFPITAISFLLNNTVVFKERVPNACN